MARLFDFDYKSPFFYMVTLKRLDGLADLSRIGDDGRLVKWQIVAADAAPRKRRYTTAAMK